MSKDKDISLAGDEPVVENRWARLRHYTDARIGLGRAGVSVPTEHLLAFQLAHATAQDAVHRPLNIHHLAAELSSRDWCPEGSPIGLHSNAVDRASYLQRPDFGRQLDKSSSQHLATLRDTNTPYDLVIAIVDGLSARAIEDNALPFLDTLLPLLKQESEPWRIAPLCLVEQGRVAIGDAIGEALGARCVLMLIGERPGLSSPDSMGLYMTWGPKVGNTDASRNCVSNIRAAGLSYREACRRILYLLTEARIKKLSGVQLKDRTSDEVLAVENNDNNFLTGDKSNI